VLLRLRYWAAVAATLLALPAAHAEEVAEQTATEAAGPPRPQWIPECELPTDDEILGLDWLRRNVFSSVCRSARWFDSFFGEEYFKDTEMDGSLSFAQERRQGGERNFAPRLRIRGKLPNISRRFDVFIDRDDENKTIVGQSDNPAMAQLNQPQQETTQLGLGYELRRTLDSLLNFRAGLRLRSGALDPFVQSRYSHDFARSETREWRVSQTLFWRQIEGFGETTALDFSLKLGGANLLRWENNATLSQSTDAFRWASAVSLYHSLSEHKALQLSYSANGETGQHDPVANFGPRLSYRQQLDRKWLFGEVYGGIDHLKGNDGTPRQREPYVGVKIELLFRGT
jgi:hypothetical protein